jgi:hypothetical protein
VLVGDTNLNFLNYEKHEPTAKYLDIMLQNNLITRITKPTRIKHKSATLIDIILTKDNELAKHSGILLREIKGNHGYTDHLPVFTILSTKTEKKKKPTHTLREYITKQNRSARREALRRQNWSEIYMEQNPNKIFDKLQSLYGNHYHANVTKRLVKNDCYNVKTEPWMREDIMKDIRKRDKLVKIKSRRKEYKNLRNQIVKNSREAEKDFIKDKIKENWNNMKEQWKVINNVTGKLNNKTEIIDCFLHDGKWVEDVGENAENFNRYYANVGKATEGEIGPGRKSPSSYLGNHCLINPEKLLFSENVGQDVIKACEKMKKKTSKDPFGFAQSEILNDIDILAPVIAHLMNKSQETGICPQNSKIAKVIPVFKNKGKNFLYENYRPISLLSIFSKIMERLIYDKVFDFLVRYEILFKSQYGFRKGHNTSHAIVDFLGKVTRAHEGGTSAWASSVTCLRLLTQ